MPDDNDDDRPASYEYVHRAAIEYVNDIHDEQHDADDFNPDDVIDHACLLHIAAAVDQYVDSLLDTQLLDDRVERPRFHEHDSPAGAHPTPHDHDGRAIPHYHHGHSVQYVHGPSVIPRPDDGDAARDGG